MKPTHMIYRIWIREGQLFFISYLRIGFPSMHREEKPSPYASRPDPKEKKEKKKGWRSEAREPSFLYAVWLQDNRTDHIHVLVCLQALIQL